MNTCCHITINYLYYEYLPEVIIIYKGLLFAIWNDTTVSKKIITMITWNHIIISVKSEYLIAYKYGKTKDYYQIETTNWKHVIVCRLFVSDRNT